MMMKRLALVFGATAICSLLAGCSGEDPIEDPITGCQNDPDCAGDPAGSYCDLTVNACVACLNDSHCDEGQSCNTGLNVCVELSTACDPAGLDIEGAIVTTVWSQGYTQDPLVAVVPDGRIAVAWFEVDDGGSTQILRSRLFNGDLTPLSETVVLAEENQPRGATLTAGRTTVLLTWSSMDNTSWGALLDTSGALVGSPFPLEAISSYVQTAVFDGSSFWLFFLTDDDTAISRLRMDEDGSVGTSKELLDTPARVASVSACYREEAFLVTWQDYRRNPDSDPWYEFDAYGKIFTASGDALTGELAVSVGPGGAFGPAALCSSDGFAVAWYDFPPGPGALLISYIESDGLMESAETISTMSSVDVGSTAAHTVLAGISYSAWSRMNQESPYYDVVVAPNVRGVPECPVQLLAMETDHQGPIPPLMPALANDGSQLILGFSDVAEDAMSSDFKLMVVPALVSK